MTEEKEQKIQAEIDACLKARKEAWSKGAPTKEISQKLAELYEDLRLAKAERKNGDRSSIIKRARIDRELEKLSER